MSASDTLGTGELLGRPSRGAFAGWPMVIGWAAMVIFALYACTHMVAAGDTWVAMACGRHFVNHGVDTVEPFSANAHKAGPTAEEIKTWPGPARWIADKVGLDTVRYWHPTGWVNQNWLTHVIFYKLTTMLGSKSQPYYDALVWWKFAIYILAAAVMYFTARLYGVNRALAVVAVCFALYIARSFLDIRPAGFSNLLVAVFMFVLALASYRNAKYIWLIVPLIVFWSNVHGGYIYAFIVLVPFIAWHAIMNLPRRWTIAAYAILLWLALFGLTIKSLGHEHLDPIVPWKIAAFYLVILGIAGSIALSINRKVSDSAIVVYHTVVSCFLALILLLYFFPVLPAELTRRDRELLQADINGSLLAFLGIFSLAMLLGAVVVTLKDKVVQKMEWRGVLHTVTASVVAFVAMVIFNPFHLTNLTHTFVISVSKHAEQWRNVHEWHRAFDMNNPVGTAIPFAVMYGLAWLALVAWVVFYVYTSRVVQAPVAKKAKLTYAWPKIDLGLLIIAGLTVYMAIRSRRFIPIAGFAACPIIAVLLDHTIRVIAAVAQTAREGKLEVPSLPEIVSWITVVAGGATVLVFGLIWGVKFYGVYLDYWAVDPVYKSVFMRMTASDAKPFAACEFIRKNKLSGKMFNYWTEGGFIAWGQDPDPKTGQTPLQLFMDGRAQAAYDVDTFDLWSNIQAGGPAANLSLIEGRQPTREECIQIGEWIDKQLKKQNVWVVLMPRDQFNKPFTDGIEYSSDWRIAYMDDKQRLFVDISTPQGQQLFQGMFTGKTIYPDEYSRKLTLGHNLLLFQDPAQKKKGLDMLIEALNEQFAPAPMLEMVLMGWQFPDLRPRIIQVCAQYDQDFEKNRVTYARQDGCNQRFEAMRWALVVLRQMAQSKGETQVAQAYEQQIDSCDVQREQILRSKRW